MKKFFEEFKKFITRGNVVDMAVGVIVGSSFTAIVNGMSNYILKPIINWLLALTFGKNSLSEVYTFLGDPVYDEAGVIILEESIYIDWGAFINSVLNFFLVAFVLFTIVKIINKVREERDEMKEKIRRNTPTRAQRKEMKKLGIKLHDYNEVQKYLDNYYNKIEEDKKKAEAEAKEKARLELEANPTADMVLREIRDILKTNLGL
jgi:large conductance mechanosensitive channel